MEVTFWGVRGSIPAPGPGTVRYGGNTSCVAVRTDAGRLLVLDCGTGARSLGIALLEDAAPGEFATGQGTGAILLSHTHWDHIQGVPFFGPLYVEGNAFTIYGPAESSALLTDILEGQMAPHYFPVQTLKNMGAKIEIVATAARSDFEVLGCRVMTGTNSHGRGHAMAFRIEHAGKSVVYASDAGYATDGPSPQMLELYRDADLLIHDSTYTREDRLRYPQRGLASVVEAVAAARAAGARRLALFHYDQDYTDTDVDLLVEQARREIETTGARVELLAAAEGLTIRV